MSLHKQESENVLLGSGELYILENSLIADPEKLTPEEEAKLINIGAIESGCTINIATDKKDIRSANRGLIARWNIDKNVTLQTGIMTWVMENVSKYLMGSKYTSTDTEKKMVVGLEDNAPPVYLRFIHEKRTGGQLIVNIYKASFDGDLSFVFDKENPTSINYEFVAMASGKGKNYVEFIETFPTEEEPVIP